LKILPQKYAGFVNTGSEFTLYYNYPMLMDASGSLIHAIDPHPSLLQL
jgi:hypothetical protein